MTAKRLHSRPPALQCFYVARFECSLPAHSEVRDVLKPRRSMTTDGTIY